MATHHLLQRLTQEVALPMALNMSPSTVPTQVADEEELNVIHLRGQPSNQNETLTRWLDTGRPETVAEKAYRTELTHVRELIIAKNARIESLEDLLQLAHDRERDLIRVLHRYVIAEQNAQEETEASKSKVETSIKLIGNQYRFRLRRRKP